jgi:hypothetical protein
MINHYAEELFARFVPFQIDNIVEYNKNGHVVYGKIEEVRGTFATSKGDKKFEVIYRINSEVVAQDSILRKVAEK